MRQTKLSQLVYFSLVLREQKETKTKYSAPQCLTTQSCRTIQYFQLMLGWEQTCPYQCFDSRIENSNNQQSAGRRIFSLAFLKPFSCVGILYIIYTLSGPDTIQIYLIYILEESGSSISPNIGPIISGSLGLFCAGIKYSLNSQFFFESDAMPTPNKSQTQPLWVKEVQIVPNRHTLVGFAFGFLHLATIATLHLRFLYQIFFLSLCWQDTQIAIWENELVFSSALKWKVAIFAKLRSSKAKPDKV